jgi:putative endonuclease
MNKNQQIGAFGEKLAAEYLTRHGYVILDTNVKNSYQELDIVAAQGKWLVFVEVKTRLSQSYGDGIEAMSQKKQTALKYAINKYIGAGGFDNCGDR